jgi:catechol 2,3-dioxygenase-like lactoylglutathione lyase family enzyme
MRHGAQFATTIIDIGMVVRDLQSSVEFYTEAMGFTEIVGFDVPVEVAGDSGLTDYQPLQISVLRIGVEDGTPSTQVKLMEIPGVETQKADTQFIHSHFGINYISIFVSDMDAVVARLEDAGVTPLAKGRVALPMEFAIGAILRPPEEWDPEAMSVEPELPENVYLIVVKDPDGNFIELVGP